MKKQQIPGVTRYFEPYVNDCFQNALAAQLLHMKLDPGIILADYLSFMYNSENGYIGLNYVFKPNTTVEFSEEELNTSLEFVYFPVPSHYTDTKPGKKFKDRITVNMYIESDENMAYEHVRMLIDRGVPAMVAVDLYYMPYHRAYRKDHGLHYIIITGYDTEEGYFEVFDKYKLSSSDFDGRLSFEDVRMARNSDNPQNNAILGDYKRPLQNIWIKTDIPESFQTNDEKAFHILSESCRRLGGERKILGNECGLGRLEELKTDLIGKKNEGIDPQNAFLFRTYYNESFKTIARSRKRFDVFAKKLDSMIPEAVLDKISGHMNNSAKHWDIAANISLKLSITKSLTLIDNLCEQLEQVKTEESRALECLNSRLLNNAEA